MHPSNARGGWDTSSDSNALFEASSYEPFDWNDWSLSWDVVDASSGCPRESVSYYYTPPSFDGSACAKDEAYSLSGMDSWCPNNPALETRGPNARPGSFGYTFESPSSHLILGGPEGIQVPGSPVISESLCLESSTSIPISCDWPQCAELGPFSSVEEWKIHVKRHARGVRNSWKPLELCCWPGCRSKARHKTLKLFEDHLNNIHINPLVCTFEGCRHKKPFRGKPDLQRHINSAHREGPKVKCPFLRCMSEGREFSRKDKLISHLREVHDTDSCPYRHCVEKLDPRTDSTAKHIGKLHGGFECAVKSCKRSVSPSQFCETGFLEHLQLGHKMGWDSVLKTRDLVQNAGSKTLRDEHIRWTDVSDCNVCSESRDYT